MLHLPRRSWEARPGGKEPVRTAGKSCLPPPPQGLVSLPEPLVASLRPSCPPPMWGWWEGSPLGLSQEKVGNGKPCAPEPSDLGL